MVIRPATIEDIPELIRLVNSAYRGEGGWTGEAHLIGGPRTTAADLEESLREPGSVILIGWEADADGERLRKGDGKRAGEELMGCVYLKKDKENLFLGMLSVWPAKQGTGVGKRLMAAAEGFARAHGLKAIRITVISVRDELIDWYERHGFRRTGEFEPFHAGDRFGTVKRPLELVVLEKEVEPSSDARIG